MMCTPLHLMMKTAHRGRRFDAPALRRVLPILSVSTYQHVLLVFVALFVVVSLIFVPRHLFPPNLPGTDELVVDRNTSVKVAPCSSTANGTICCDGTGVCFMNGVVQTHSLSGSILLVSPNMSQEYSGVGGLRLRTANRTTPCDVRHDVPAVVFSTGGFVGNAYREFSDGLIPLYIASRRFNQRVVFVAIGYDARWFGKYRDVVLRLSDFPPVDFANDKRTHCFPRAIVGLEIHGGLTINPALMADGTTSIHDFRTVLEEAYKPQRTSSRETSTRPKLVFISRQASRKIENEPEVVELAIDVGFKVQVLRPHPKLEPVKTYRTLTTCDVVVGVYGAEMTHFLFVRAGRVLVQVVPLGTEQAADARYGTPARESGLTYVGYRITPRESSLYREYRKEDAVLTDAENVSAKAWETAKKIYLNGQNVNLDLSRFGETLVRAYEHVVKEKQIRALKERMDLGG